MMFCRRVAISALLLGVGACALSMSAAPKQGVSFTPSAHAQGIIRNLIARLRGQTLPEGIVKSNGRIEATQVDVSSKYAGRLAQVNVEEGSSVTQGQVIAKLTSPEYDAQLRAAKADVQKANDALAAAEAEITSRQSALEFAKSDFERGQELMKTGFITKQVFEQRKRNLRFCSRRGEKLHLAARSGFVSYRERGGGGRSHPVDHRRSDAGFAPDGTGAVPACAGGRGRRRRRADRHHPRSHRRLHDALPACSRCGQAGGWRRGSHHPRSGSRLRHSGERQLRRRRRAVHAENRRDHGRAGETDVSRQAQDRCAGSSAVLHAGEDRRAGPRLRAHQGRSGVASRPSDQAAQTSGG